MLDVVHIFITAKASKHRLTELTCYAVPSVLAGTAVLKDAPSNLDQARRIINSFVSLCLFILLGSADGVQMNHRRIFRLDAEPKRHRRLFIGEMRDPLRLESTFDHPFGDLLVGKPEPAMFVFAA